MKSVFSIIRNLVIAILLIVLGIVIGQRYSSSIPLMAPNLEKQDSILQEFTDGLRDRSILSEDRTETSFNVFWEVWSILDEHYLEPEKLDDTQMIDGAIQGMVGALDDPYTVYLPPDDHERAGQDLDGAFYGVGIELGYKDDVLAVVSPLEGTPADQVGLEAGDLILHVYDENKGIDEDSSQWSLTEAVEKIRGPKGTEITFSIYREGVEEPFDVTMVRGEILVDTVDLRIIEDQGSQIAHVKVSRFGGRTKQEWDSAVGTILAHQPAIAGIVLDLRNNPGGYFDGAIDLASDFIEHDVVVTQKGRFSQQDFYSNGEGRLKHYPLVVLVNKGTASASEILAGALRDDLGVKLVGTQTFGKGTVQDRIELSNQGGVHVTVGRWMLPGGDWIHDEGIPVDVEVEFDRDTEEDEVFNKGLEVLNF